ncbi:MAG: hypothetical protein ABSH36_00515 [Solirubrobacteraceae bacterium]
MTIDADQARTIAGNWHAGQWRSALYSFSSAGASQIDALSEVEQELSALAERKDQSEVPELRRELESLADYLQPTTWRAQAREVGEDAGRAAGSWAADGNTPTAAAIRALRGIQDGNPEVWDSLPREPSLSREHTPEKLALEIVGEQREQPPDSLSDELAEAWQEGVTATFTDACVNALEGAVQWIETRYGDALFTKNGIQLRATREQTREWARRWSSSKLSGRGVVANLINDLDDASAAYGISAAEFNAWVAEVLILAARNVGLTIAQTWDSQAFFPHAQDRSELKKGA